MCNKYQLVKDGEKYAIFDCNGNQVSQFWDYIYPEGIICGESEYYSVENEDERQAIFHINDPNKPVTKWWFGIVVEVGVLRGQSPYYLAQNDAGDFAIFHINDPNKPVTKWWDIVMSEGLVEGDSKQYYIARDEKIQFYIFSVNNPNKPIAIFEKSSDAIKKLEELIKQEKLKDNLSFQFNKDCYKAN